MFVNCMLLTILEIFIYTYKLIVSPKYKINNLNNQCEQEW